MPTAEPAAEPTAEPTVEPTAKPTAEPHHDAPQAAGGWTPAKNASVTDERKAVFNKGMAAMMGVKYEAVAYLGSQTVSGTNHAFLVKGAAVSPGQSVSYSLACLYEDTLGNVKVTNVTTLGIVPGKNGTATPPTDGSAGAWHYAESSGVTKEMKERLEAAQKGMTGASYEAVANLGEQLVAGTNRCLLCRETSGSHPHYALVYVYEDAQGGATTSQVIKLDLDELSGK